MSSATDNILPHQVTSKCNIIVGTSIIECVERSMHCIIHGGGEPSPACAGVRPTAAYLDGGHVFVFPCAIMGSVKQTSLYLLTLQSSLNNVM